MARRRMAQSSKRAYVESIYLRHRQGIRVEKQKLLDEVRRVCDDHRNAIGLLNRPLTTLRQRQRCRPGAPLSGRARAAVAGFEN